MPILHSTKAGMAPDQTWEIPQVQNLGLAGEEQPELIWRQEWKPPIPLRTVLCALLPSATIVLTSPKSGLVYFLSSSTDGQCKQSSHPLLNHKAMFTCHVSSKIDTLLMAQERGELDQEMSKASGFDNAHKILGDVKEEHEVPLLCFQGNLWENLRISCVINFKDLKLNYGNFLPLLIKPIYIFFQVDGLPISWSICVGGYSRLFLWILLFICYRNKEQNQHGTELYALDWSISCRPSRTEMGPLRIHLTLF